jgi:hypothetical protein
MRLVFLCLLTGQFLAAQAPRVSVIEFYGLRQVSVARVRQALEVKEGDPLPPSKAAVEERLEKVDGVVLARLEAVCCEAGGAILFLGIEEKGAPHFDLRPAPASPVVLPEDLVATHRAFLDRYQQSASTGQDRESLVRGYALAAESEVRAYQERFVEVAGQQFEIVRQVLRESAEAEHRAIAAYLTGYAPDKQAAVEALLYALQDPEPAVRHTAMRALSAIAVFASKNPDAALRISPTWPIEMLNSIVWGDRTQAANLLEILTEGREARSLDQIRERALPSLVEMARWKSLPHALPAYVLLGRIAGLPEKQIQETWSKGERERVISEQASRLGRRN